MTTNISRIDANQPDIVRDLRKAGCMVESLAAVGKGMPDLLVGYSGRLYLLEVKTQHGKLTGDQVMFFNRWYGYANVIHVVRSAEEALRVVGAITSESEI